MKQVNKRRRTLLSIMVMIVIAVGIINVNSDKMIRVNAQSIEVLDTFDSIIIEDEQVPLHFVSIESEKEEGLCFVHWEIFAILAFAFIMLLILRKLKKAYIIELVSVGVVSIILCFAGRCRLDWIFAISGAILLESMDIIFVRKYDKEIEK